MNEVSTRTARGWASSVQHQLEAACAARGTTLGAVLDELKAGWHMRRRVAGDNPNMTTTDTFEIGQALGRKTEHELLDFLLEVMGGPRATV